MNPRTQTITQPERELAAARPKHAHALAWSTLMLLIACLVAAALAACLVLAAGTDAAYAASKPAKVTNVKATSKSYKAIKVSWKKVSGAKKYVVYRSTKKGSAYKKVGTSTSASLKDTSCTTGTTYYYKVRAYNGAYGAYSAAASARAVCAATSSIKANGGENKATVKWAKVAGASGYRVYRASSSSGTYKLVGTVSGASTLSYKDTGLTAGKTYYYKVRAYHTVDGAKVNGKLSSANAATIDGYLDVTEAYELLNEFRTTKGIWYWNSDDETKTYFNKTGYTTLSELSCDSSLESTAQTRAKELSTLFSHTRPDGTSCFTAFPDNIWAGGENIAAGYSSCTSVINGWAETNYSYSGQGHRRNMLSEDFTSVGIACYVSDGYKYWAMDLASFEDEDEDW